MVLKNLASLAKARKELTLYDDTYNDEQWLRVRDGVYPLHGLPWFEDIEMLLNVLDVKEKDRDKLILNHTALPKGLNFNDDDKEEKSLGYSELQLKLGSFNLLPARTSMGLRFFESEYLNPLSDLAGKYEIKERMAAGNLPYLAVKGGLLIKAIIMPTDLSETRMAEELQNLHTEMMTTLSYMAQSDREAENE